VNLLRVGRGVHRLCRVIVARAVSERIEKLRFRDTKGNKLSKWKLNLLSRNFKDFITLVVIGTKKMERDPKGVQNLLEFLWDYIRDLARTNW
jgi:hypothetical protein